MKAIITVIETARTNAIDQAWFAFEPAIVGKRVSNKGCHYYALVTGVFADDIEEAKTVACRLEAKYRR